ncbi:group II intron maturase-specific domain-containing protein [Flavobacterium sp.]|uniref:group II intron maturase-specific domain-containing protein n=1 Tax=Flavobacterium sp. TaxID=239 RepID=UPI00262E212A|nr:group II intron maturase-specific domain-containing protein [Flavobacterium sp.]
MFLGFDCEISQKSQTRIVQKWKDLKFHKQSNIVIQDIATKLRLQIIGISRYYGYFNVASLRKLFRYLQNRLAKWVRNKYKSMGRSYTKAHRWLAEIKISYPTLFYHWQLFKSV